MLSLVELNKLVGGQRLAFGDESCASIGRKQSSMEESAPQVRAARFSR
jgi:hypothetical protein